MHMQNLSDLNDIYNMQDTILFYKIFENRAMEIIKKCPYNPSKSHWQARLVVVSIDLSSN